MVNVEVLSATDQVVTALVTENDGSIWLLIVVYASPNYQVQEELWQHIMELSYVVNLSWVVIGDVNQPLEAKDKRGERPINRHLATKLRQTIDNCKLIDIGFQGPQLTWSNSQEGKAKKRERIDSAWCNTPWHQIHERTMLKHLTRVASDHHSLLLMEVSNGHNEAFRGFRFLEAWFLNPDFPKKVKELWNREPGNLQQTMEQFRDRICKWNQEEFENIF